MKIIRNILAALLTLALVLGVSTAAVAADWGTGGKGNDNTPRPKPKPKPGDPGTGGSAGGTSGTWSASGIIWGNPVSKKASAPFPQAPGSPTKTLACSGSNTWGPILGMTWQSWGIRTTDGTSDNGSYRYNALSGASKNCIDAPHYVIQSRHCITRITGSVSYAYGNTAGIAVKKLNLGTTTTPFAASGGKDLSKCSASYTKNFKFTDELWGQYHGLADAYERIATVKHFTTANAKTGKKQADVLMSLGAERKINPVSLWWTQSCRGVEAGRIARSFDGNGCKDTPGSTSNWTCGLVKTSFPYVGNVRNNSQVEIFHDGKKQNLTWRAQPKPTGDIRTITGKKVKLTYKTGTPFRTGSSSSAADQFFSTTPVMDRYKTGWTGIGSTGQTTFAGQFFKAGMPGAKKNLALAPIWALTAEFKHQSAKVTGITSEGKLVFTKVTTWDTSTATCEGLPTNLAITRARLSN